jgi:hypothetical protein
MCLFFTFFCCAKLSQPYNIVARYTFRHLQFVRRAVKDFLIFRFRQVRNFKKKNETNLKTSKCIACPCLRIYYFVTYVLQEPPAILGCATIYSALKKDFQSYSGHRRVIFYTCQLASFQAPMCAISL